MPSTFFPVNEDSFVENAFNEIDENDFDDYDME